ncbi:MAG: carbonate dehydratase [Betaproteobacteria bacterium]|jgi:carbonic anhydrase
MSNPYVLQELFENNKNWVESVTQEDPDFFNRLSDQQSPDYLWIGCSDSRVPANQITGLAPGEIFVHRNIANVIAHTDLNALSVIQFAIDLLKVKHIIVVGHYGCSGVRASLENIRVGLADNWIRHITDVKEKHGKYLGKILEHQACFNALCELNVIEQVVNVCQTTMVQDAWIKGQELTVHGWVYGLNDGMVRDLDVSIRSSDELSLHYNSVIQKRYS